MESSCALVPESARQLDGVTSFDRHRLAAALMETNHASFQDVDRREDVEVLC